jgi:hypothetical protein
MLGHKGKRQGLGVGDGWLEATPKSISMKLLVAHNPAPFPLSGHCVSRRKTTEESDFLFWTKWREATCTYKQYKPHET